MDGVANAKKPLNSFRASNYCKHLKKMILNKEMKLLLYKVKKWKSIQNIKVKLE